MSIELDGQGHVPVTLESAVAGQLVLEFPANGPVPVELRQIFKGPKGDSAGAFVVTATSAIGGYRCLIMDEAGQLAYADSANAAHARRIVGVTKQAYESGASVELLRFADLEDGSWDWDVNLPVYLGHNGVFTQTVPAAPDAAFMLVLGMPISTTKLLINVREPLALQ